jgi:hypothetical protein
MRLYRLQLLPALTPADHVASSNFSIEMLVAHDDDEDFLRLVFSNKATFHLSGKVNRHNVHIWGAENSPQATVQNERDSPKVNIFCAILSQKVYGPFFFLEKTVTGILYLDMLSFVSSLSLRTNLKTSFGNKTVLPLILFTTCGNS